MLILIKNAQIVNEGKIYNSDVLIENQKIKEVADKITINADQIINAEGLHLLPGVIDDQVHFREPGLTHKANIYTESKAAVAGGITSFMEMPNTNPQALTQELLENKYQIASDTSIANYSFFMGASNDNLEEVLKTNPKNVKQNLPNVCTKSAKNLVRADFEICLEILCAIYNGYMSKMDHHIAQLLTFECYFKDVQFCRKKN